MVRGGSDLGDGPLIPYGFTLLVFEAAHDLHSHCGGGRGR
jgi:hypothetical protein